MAEKGAVPQVGKVKVGSEHPIALQTMTTTDTRNVQATVDQVDHPTRHPAKASHTCTVPGSLHMQCVRPLAHVLYTSSQNRPLTQTLDKARVAPRSQHMTQLHH